MRLAALALLIAATATTHAQWEIEDSHTTASLRGIHNVGGGIAWASGTGGTVLRTLDEGKNWQTCPIPPDADKLDFRGIQAFDENTAIVMSSGPGDLSRLYKTTDGCQTWKLLFTNPDKDGFWDAIKFTDLKIGFLLGDPVRNTFMLWNTADGGKTWNINKRKGLSANPKLQGAFAASNTALTIGSNERFPSFGSGGKAGAFVYHLDTITICLDDCSASEAEPRENWLKTSLPLANGVESAGTFSLATQGGVKIATGGDYLKPESTLGTASFSLDEGKTWFPAQTPPHGYRSAVAYDPTTKTWITVGPNGTDISTDDGRNWRPLTPTPQDAPDADKNWNALSLPFVVGPKGRIGKLRPLSAASASKASAKP